jgi:hypothetical protein
MRIFIFQTDTEVRAFGTQSAALTYFNILSENFTLTVRDLTELKCHESTDTPTHQHPNGTYFHNTACLDAYLDGLTDAEKLQL